jgi:hypothetical protein
MEDIPNHGMLCITCRSSSASDCSRRRFVAFKNTRAQKTIGGTAAAAAATAMAGDKRGSKVCNPSVMVAGSGSAWGDLSFVCLLGAPLGLG